MRSPVWRASGGRRGTMLVLTLWLTLVLAVIAYSLSHEMQLGLRMTSQAQRRVKALAIARAGLAKAVADLRNDRLISAAAQGRNSDTDDETWSRAKDKTDIEFGGGTYSVRVVDEDGKLDMNGLTPTNRGALEYVLERVCGVREEDAKVIAMAVVDFKDPDVFQLEKLDEDEIQYYTEWGLKKYGRDLPAEWQFRPKNDTFIDIEELLEIPGITREVLYGDPAKIPADPIERIDEKEKNAALIDYVTIGKNEPVNINTCPLEVLEALLYVNLKSDSAARDTARGIDKLRHERLEYNGAKVYGVSSLAQLNDNGFDLKLLAGSLPVNVFSNNFTIYSRGEFGSVRQSLGVECNVTNESFPIDPDNAEHAGLRDPNASGRIKNRVQLVFDPSVRVIKSAQ
ncbi:MAG: general secretion pathway protein GspK [bacterium]|nr:general secretion pathway protein GspK [bacterium]